MGIELVWVMSCLNIGNISYWLDVEKAKASMSGCLWTYYRGEWITSREDHTFILSSRELGDGHECSGYDEGYREGRRDGELVGEEEGYQKGVREGYDQGLEDGYAKGWNEGG